MAETVENRVAKLEGYREGLDTFLPRLLQRFESTEAHMAEQLQKAEDERAADRKAANWSRWGLVVAILSVAVALYLNNH